MTTKVWGVVCVERTYTSIQHKNVYEFNVHFYIQYIHKYIHIDPCG